MSTFNIDTATFEEAVVYAVTKIVEQGSRCTNSGGICVYGAEDNTKHCAVGWLLPNDPVLMSFEGSVYCLVRYHEDKLPAIIVKNPVGFATLQRFHDYNSDVLRKGLLIDLEERSGIPFSSKYPVFNEWIALGE